jgi:DNA-binding CsgD family transcriptional regulator
MQYIFIFLLVSCITVGIITTIIAFTLFFRNKTLLEKYFLLFLTFLTLRLINDTILFYLLPLFSSSPGFFFASFFLGRIFVPGSLIFLTLFIHKLTNKFQSRKASIIFYCIFVLLFLFFVIEFVVVSWNSPPTIANLYTFSFVDFFYYILPLYPIIIFIVFRKNVKDIAFYKMIRGIIIIFGALFPLMIIEDLLGVIPLDSNSQLQLKLFPAYYLALCLFILVSGFKNIVAARKDGRSPDAISEQFIAHFGITAREKEIISLIMQGDSNRTIAKKLFISPATVRNHLHNIFEKTNASNRVELVRIATL